jgi:molybdopterin synthase catalytic subunit
VNEFLTFFTNTETPFAILFVILFVWYVRENKAREERQLLHYQQLQDHVEQQIGEIQNDLKTMLTIWKLLIENEIKRRKEE